VIASFKTRTPPPEKELDLFPKVKPTADMPSQGAHLWRVKKSKKPP